MTIELPRAGTDAGRAAVVQQDPGGGAAEMFAQLGRTMANVGIGLENDRLSRERQRLQVDMTRDLNDLRLRLSEIGDPDDLEHAWASESQAIRTRYATGTMENGRPLVDPRNQEQFGLIYDDLANRTASQIGVQALSARQSQREAGYLSYTHEASRAAAGSDAATRAVLVDQGRQQIEDMVSAGVISYEEGQRRVLALQADLDNTATLDAINTDPAGWLAALDAGEYPGLAGDTSERYRVQATNAVTRQQEEIVKEQEAADVARQSAIADRLVEIRQVAATGRGAVDEAFLDSPEVQASPEFNRTMATIQLRNEKGDISRLTTEELQAAIAAEADQDIAYAWQNDRLVVLNDQLKIAQAADVQRAAEVSERLVEIRDVGAAGRSAVDEGFLASPEVQASPEYGRTMATLQLRDQMGDITRATPAELRAAIAAEKDRPIVEAWENDRLTVLNDQLKVSEQGWRADPVAYAETLGLDGFDPLPEFDPSSPAAFSAALQSRVVAGQSLVATGYTTSPRTLSDEDRATVQQLAAVSNDPADRLAFAMAVAPSLRGAGADSLQNVVTDPVFLHLGIGAARHEIPAATVLDAFRGQQIMDAGTVVMPSAADRTDAGFQVLGTLFSDDPYLQSAIAASADAIYASRTRQTGPVEAIDTALYSQSLHEALGGSGNYDSRGAKGGLQSVRGIQTIMPRGINSDDIEDAAYYLGARQANIDELAVPDQDLVYGPNSTVVPDLDQLQANLAAISTNGNPPSLNGAPIDYGLWRSMQFQAVGTDRYVVGRYVNGSFQVLQTEDQTPYVISFQALLRTRQQ